MRNQKLLRKIKYIHVGNIAYKVINGFTERINNENVQEKENKRNEMFP